MPKILLITASGNQTAPRLQLAAEERNIRGALGRYSNFTVTHESEATAQALVDRLVLEQPEILHFAGHGAGGPERGIFLSDDSGQSRLAQGSWLRGILDNLRNRPRLVFLNCCYSSEQASALCASADVVVAVKGAVLDSWAQSFAASFYRFLGESYSVDKAFRLAKGAIDPEGRAGNAISIHWRRGTARRDVTFYARPELMAQFACDEESGIPQHKRDHYNVELWVRGAEPQVEAVTYQVCHESFAETKQNFWEVTRAEDRRFYVDDFWTNGDVNVRITTWSRGLGLGFESTLVEALRRHYVPDPRRYPKLKRAFTQILEN